VIVGFSGRAGAGKDTAAGPLLEEGWVKLSFAEPLKRMLCELFGWDMANWENLEWKETPRRECMDKTPRYMAQTLGTEWGRELVHPNLWVETALNRARMLEARGANIVFTDVRFPNEAKAIKNNGGMLIHMMREGELRTDARHESEQDIGYLAHECILAREGEIDVIRTAALHLVRHFEALK